MIHHTSCPSASQVLNFFSAPKSPEFSLHPLSPPPSPLPTFLADLSLSYHTTVGGEGGRRRRRERPQIGAHFLGLRRRRRRRRRLWLSGLQWLRRGGSSGRIPSSTATLYVDSSSSSSSPSFSSGLMSQKRGGGGGGPSPPLFWRGCSKTERSPRHTKNKNGFYLVRPPPKWDLSMESLLLRSSSKSKEEANESLMPRRVASILALRALCLLAGLWEFRVRQYLSIILFLGRVR